MYCVLALVSAGLGSMGGWQESAPSTRAERLAEFSFNAIRGGGDGVLDSGLVLQDAEIMELTSYRTQVMRHTAHRLMTHFNTLPPPPPPPLPPPSHSAQSAISHCPVLPTPGGRVGLRGPMARNPT